MLTITDVCDRLNCSPDTVYRLIHSGLLEAHKNPGRNGAMRISETALDAYVAASKVVTPRKPEPVAAGDGR